MSRCPNPFQQSQLNRAAKFWKSEIKESDIEIGRRRERQLIAEAEAFADAHRKPMGREDWELGLLEVAADHIHLPSVHIRAHNGVGLNYEENFFHRGGRWERVIRLEILRGNAPALVRETFDVLCTQELAGLHEVLPILMDKRNPAAKPIMEEAARREFERQVRIAGGQEIACVNCGCSETRSCSGGCCWATETLCSRCV